MKDYNHKQFIDWLSGEIKKEEKINDKLLTEAKLSKYWKARAKRRALKAERKWPNKADRDWALAEQEKSSNINGKIYALFEKELEETEDMSEVAKTMMRRMKSNLKKLKLKREAAKLMKPQERLKKKKSLSKPPPKHKKGETVGGYARRVSKLGVAPGESFGPSVAMQESLVSNKEIDLIIENLIIGNRLEEAMLSNVANLARSAYNSVKAEVDNLKNQTAQYAYDLLKKSIEKINGVIATLQQKGLINLKIMRSLQLKMKVLLIPKHAKFLGSVVMAILKLLAVSGLSAVLPMITGVTNFQQLQQKYADFKEKFLTPINNFIGGIDNIISLAENAIKAGRQALIAFCLNYLGIDTEEIEQYIPNIEELIQDLKNAGSAVISNLGLQAALEENNKRLTAY